MAESPACLLSYRAGRFTRSNRPCRDPANMPVSCIRLACAIKSGSNVQTIIPVCSGWISC